jgi:hypothetical protein
MQVLQKSEGGKIRRVAKTENSVNGKMNYLSEVLERDLHGSRLSTLFAGEAGSEQIDYDLIIEPATLGKYLWTKVDSTSTRAKRSSPLRYTL